MLNVTGLENVVMPCEHNLSQYSYLYLWTDERSELFARDCGVFSQHEDSLCLREAGDVERKTAWKNIREYMRDGEREREERRRGRQRE